MTRRIALSFLIVLSLVVVASVPMHSQAQDATPVAQPMASPQTATTGGAGGFTNPRGFTWDANGAIVLALAGSGGPNQVVVEGTPWPFFGGSTSSIVRIVDGCPAVIADGLPSGIWTDANWVWGIMDVAFVEGQLYALSGGGGGSWGNPEVPNGVYRVNDDGSTELFANLSEWLIANPTEFIPPDYDPEGSLFDMEAGSDALFVSEAVGGRVIKIAMDGSISLVADLSEGHLVPTGIAIGSDGEIYAGYETTVPYPNGGSKVSKIAEDGTVTDQWTGLTMVTDIAIGPDGALYAAEMATGNLDTEPYINPGTGRIVRQTGPDSSEIVVEGLDFPVFIGFGPDGALHFDGPAFGANDGGGWLMRLGEDGIASSEMSAACP